MRDLDKITKGKQVANPPKSIYIIMQQKDVLLQKEYSYNLSMYLWSRNTTHVVSIWIQIPCKHLALSLVSDILFLFSQHYKFCLSAGGSDTSET